MFWWALCCSVVLLFIYILSKGNQIESRQVLSKVIAFGVFVEGFKICAIGCWKLCGKIEENYLFFPFSFSLGLKGFNFCEVDL